MAQKDTQVCTELEAKLSDLRDKLSPDQFQRAKLFLFCIELAGKELDEAEDLGDLLEVIKQSPKLGTLLAVPALQYILMFVGIKQADLLEACSEDLEKVKKLLEFPALLVSLCRNLGSDGFNRFKRSVCRAVLGCSHTTINTREDLMKELVQQRKVSPDDVEVLKTWLKSARLNILVSKVTAYEDQRSEPIMKPDSFPTQSEGDESEDTRLQCSEVTILARKLDVPEKDLNRKVTESHLREIEQLQLEHKSQSVQPVDQATAGNSLEEWYRRMGDKATYRELVEEFLVKQEPRIASKVCELAKVYSCTLEQLQFCLGELVSPPLVGLIPSPIIPEGARAGIIEKILLWDITRFPKLRIFFKNPEVLKNESWQCGKEPLTTELILAWAEAWNNPAYTNYPRISTDPAPSLQDSEIRVEFGRENCCWSFIGSIASKHPGETTMYLNLYDLHSVRYQKSLVLHEFGHALGLEHEHQRWDFWKDFDNLVINKDSLPAEYLRAPWKKDTFLMQTPYDPDSIMHYWFNVHWLKPQYRDLNKVQEMTEQELTKTQRDVIEGVHKRNCKMAESPSILDFKTLNQAYAYGL